MSGQDRSAEMAMVMETVFEMKDQLAELSESHHRLARQHHGLDPVIEKWTPCTETEVAVYASSQFKHLQ